jgi:ubiquinone/menaquinone biosynthesis C-methylase UbiE
VSAIEPFLDLMRCPACESPLSRQGDTLVCAKLGHRYDVNALGIPIFVATPSSDDARVQADLYDRIVDRYLANLTYAHTMEYMDYLDQQVISRVVQPIGAMAEICCGGGEACWLFRDEVGRAIGLDISSGMLARARKRLPGTQFAFVQGDACQLPLADRSYDAVFMLGGIHHVNDRAALFAEVCRILKPGGRYYFREPLDDLWVWRTLRAAIYRMSSMLDGETERPLRRAETVAQLQKAGMQVDAWHPVGFLGWCLLMNSDVLVANRLLRFIPGIRAFTRFMTRVDEAMLRLPGFADAGTQVVGIASKPK